jgi:glycosyltransferase involved in cell wall biosynthesis
MNIVFLAHNLRQDNGGGVFARRLVEGLRDVLSAHVLALTTVPSGQPYERAILSPGRVALAARILEVRRLMRDCDVVHALDAIPYGIMAVAAGVGLGKKTVITAIGSGSILPFYRRGSYFLARYAYARADRITAISAFTRAEILKKMPGLDIGVINPGVDVADFSGGAPAAPAMLSRIRQYSPYILSVGQLRWRKGYHFSIRSFASIARDFPDLRYVIVGKRQNDVYYARLRRVIAESGMDGRVHIVEDADTRADLAAWYRGAELFCLFSQNVNHDVEGFGQVFLEAAAAGLPVVGSGDCGVDDAVRDGENGLLVAGRDPDDFARAIREILRDPARQKSMSAASSAFAAAMSWERQIGRYADLYRTLT